MGFKGQFICREPKSNSRRFITEAWGTFLQRRRQDAAWILNGCSSGPATGQSIQLPVLCLRENLLILISINAMAVSFKFCHFCSSAYNKWNLLRDNIKEIHTITGNKSTCSFFLLFQKASQSWKGLCMQWEGMMDGAIWTQWRGGTHRQDIGIMWPVCPLLAAQWESLHSMESKRFFLYLPFADTKQILLIIHMHCAVVLDLRFVDW